MTSDQDAAPSLRPDIDDLRRGLDQVIGTDIDEHLVRESALGDLSFAGSRNLFQEIADFCGSIRDLSWELIPPAKVQSLNGLVGELNGRLETVKAFSLGSGTDLSGAHGQATKQLSDAFWAFQNAAIPWVGYLKWHRASGDEFRSELATDMDRIRSESSALIHTLQERNAEAEGVIRAIRAASAEIGVSDHAETFRKAADRYAGAATKWLIAAAATGTATVVATFALVLLWETSGDLSDASVTQVILAKAVTLSVALYFTVNFFRMYRSTKHLEVVNRHREDALRTFRAFVEGAGDDDEVKAKVLLEAAHAAFGQTPTGLVGGQEGGGVLEILDGATGGIIRRR